MQAAIVSILKLCRRMDFSNLFETRGCDMFYPIYESEQHLLFDLYRLSV
jgi:hypothetical protein